MTSMLCKRLVNSTASSFKNTTEEIDPREIPHPDWVETCTALGIWWDIHVWTFTALFSIIGLAALVFSLALLCIRSKPHVRNLKKLRAGSTIQEVLVLILAAARVVMLQLDPYHANTMFPQLVYAIILTLPFPCLTSAIFLTFLGLYRVIKLEILHSRKSVLKAKIYMPVVSFNFAITIGGCILSTYMLEGWVSVVACQSLSAAWGLFMAGAFIWLFHKLYKASIGNRLKLVQVQRKGSLSMAANSEPEDEERKKPPQLAQRQSSISVFFKGLSCLANESPGMPDSKSLNDLLRLLRLFVAFAVFFMLWAAAMIYPSVAVFNPNVTKQPKPIPWMISETITRTFEVIFCAFVIVIASRPLHVLMIRRRRSSRSRSRRATQSTSATFTRDNSSRMSRSRTQQEDSRVAHSITEIEDEENDNSKSSAGGKVVRQPVIIRKKSTSFQSSLKRISEERGSAIETIDGSLVHVHVMGSPRVTAKATVTAKPLVVPDTLIADENYVTHM